MASPTRQRLVDAAKRRFYRDGFRNVGIDAVLADVGISKAAFYKIFAGKDDLMVAVLDDVDRFLQSVHGKQLMETGGERAATCTSCHTVHNMRRSEDPQSPVHATHLATTCGRRSRWSPSTQRYWKRPMSHIQ